MHRLGNDEAAHKAGLVGTMAGMLLLACAQTALAQATPPVGNPIDQAPSEAARRAALSPYRFILQNASAPARKPAPAPAAAPASPPPAVAEPKRPAPPPVQQAAVQPAIAAPASSTPAAVEATAPVPEPMSSVAALSRQPAAEPPPRLEIIPIRTDEPRLSAALLRERPHGVVKVSFDIQPDGSVGAVKVVSSSNRALNRPTVDAVHGWKFEPVDAVLTVETEVVYKMDQ